MNTVVNRMGEAKTLQFYMGFSELLILMVRRVLKDRIQAIDIRINLKISEEMVNGKC